MLFALAVVAVLGATGTGFSVSRAFVVVIGLGAIAPVATPVLLVVRTHRRNIPRRRGHENGLALAGYLFVVSSDGLAVAAMPETFVTDGETLTRSPAANAGVLAPLVAALCAILPAGSLGVPAAAAGVVALVHLLRR